MEKSLEVLGLVVSLLERNSCWYRVAGGYAVDGYAGCMTRTHNDVDALVLDSDFERIIEIFRNNDGSSFSIYPFKAEFELDGVHVDFGRFQRDQSQENYWLVTAPEHKWPASLLEGKEVTLGGIQFWVPSKDFLLSTRLLDTRVKSRRDINLLLRLGSNAKTARRYQFDFGRHRLE